MLPATKVLPVSMHKKVFNLLIIQEMNGGDGGIRTPDLRDANATLSQLSHTPTNDRILCT